MTFSLVVRAYLVVQVRPTFEPGVATHFPHCAVGAAYCESNYHSCLGFAVHLHHLMKTLVSSLLFSLQALSRFDPD